MFYIFCLFLQVLGESKNISQFKEKIGRWPIYMSIYCNTRLCKIFYLFLEVVIMFSS